MDFPCGYDGSFPLLHPMAQKGYSHFPDIESRRRNASAKTNHIRVLAGTDRKRFLAPVVKIAVIRHINRVRWYRPCDAVQADQPPD